ncbi:MAG: growth inhibitor [Halonotius sp. J07HN4]|nr:MAG: growth inhibitor [Halonotius sp. J07HN4]
MVQSDTGNDYVPTTIVAPLSRGHTEWLFYLNIPGSMAKLTVDSYVPLDQIWRVDIDQWITDQYRRVTDSQLA